MKVSIIIPTYGNRGGLNKAVKSVLTQDYSDIEVIVVDDNNPNTNERFTTEEIMHTYSSDERVKYIKHEQNSNGAVARNTGIKYATGELIGFLDDDDQFLPSKISKQVAYLINSKFNAVYCGAIYNGKKYPQYLEGNLEKDLLLLNTRMYTPSLLFYKTVLLDLKGFDEKFRRHQDYEILLRFFKRGYIIGCVSECLVQINQFSRDNIPVGIELDRIKEYFFKTFDNEIRRIEKETQNFRKSVYGVHYASNFTCHLTNRSYFLALKTLSLSTFYYPSSFYKNLFKKIISLKN